MPFLVGLRLLHSWNLQGTADVKLNASLGELRTCLQTLKCHKRFILIRKFGIECWSFSGNDYLQSIGICLACQSNFTSALSSWPKCRTTWFCGISIDGAIIIYPGVGTESSPSRGSTFRINDLFRLAGLMLGSSFVRVVLFGNS